MKQSEKYDVALLKVKSKHTLKSYDFKFGKADELKKGDFLYFIGDPLGLGISLSQAIYANKKVPYDSTIFNLNIPVAHGYSGGPVIAFRDGNPEIVGIIKLTSESNAGITKIEYALEEFKEYLQK